ncbi:unnamed protein product [Lasius platythorax]
MEVSIERINAGISDRSASLLELETATNSALADFVTHHPSDNVWQETERVERTRRRSGASRSKEGITRTSGHNTDSNMMDRQSKEKSLPPQKSRTPSGRREEPMVSGLPSSSSSVGPTSLLLAGGEYERMTAEELLNEDPKEPLVMDVIECRLFKDEFASSQEQDPPVSDVVVPITSINVIGKRRARSSPDAVSSSDEERQGVSPSLLGRIRPVTVSLRKLRSTKRKPPNDFADLTEGKVLDDTSPARMSTDAELELNVEPILSPKESPIRSLTPTRSEAPSTS